MPKSYSIVGMQSYPGAFDILKALNVGETVVLVREPKNQYDRNAVAVWVGGTKVGYIPKKQNSVLAAFIDQSGRDWSECVEAGTPTAANDAVTQIHRALDAKFIRSPNSSYPMVEV